MTENENNNSPLEVNSLPRPLKETTHHYQEIAHTKGQERKRQVESKINPFFSNIKSKLSSALDYLLGAPEVTSYLAQEAKKKTELAADRALNSVDSSVNRLTHRVSESTNRLEERVNNSKKRTQEKINDLVNRALKFGLTIGSNIEAKIAKSIYGVPEFIAQYRTDILEAKMEKQEEKILKISDKRQEAVRKEMEAHEKKMDKIQSRYLEKTGKVLDAKDAIETKANQLRENAKEIRQKEMAWGKFRSILAAF